VVTVTVFCFNPFFIFALVNFFVFCQNRCLYKFRSIIFGCPDRESRQGVQTGGSFTKVILTQVVKIL